MEELDVLKRRIEELERRMSEQSGPASGADADKRERQRRSARQGRLVLGILILLAGLLWLGQSYDIEWLQGLRMWPVAVIIFGLFLIFGE